MTQTDLWKMAFAADMSLANVHNKNCSVSLVDVCGTDVDDRLGSPFKAVFSQWRQNNVSMQVEETSSVSPADVLRYIIVDKHHGFKIIGLKTDLLDIQI